MRRLASLVLLVALAGCSDGAGTDTVPAASQDTTSTGPVAPPPAPTLEVFTVDFDGKLGTSVHGCIFVPAVVCETRGVVADDSDLYVERPGANLTAADLEITWTAATPATQTLAFGAMVMGDCEECDSEFDTKEGTSPVRLRGEGLSLALNETGFVHVYAYNPKGAVFNPAVPGYVIASAEQSFHIAGTLTFLVPPA